jgi:ubiquinone/menaquinone biosynthesis C-methylase UbiE/predicted transcriptional regulator
MIEKWRQRNAFTRHRLTAYKEKFISNGVTDAIAALTESPLTVPIGSTDSLGKSAVEAVRLVPGSLLDLFRVLGDATRLRIVALLDQMELAVGEIAHLLDQSQPRVSRHIRLLEEVGLVERRREGSWVFVRLVSEGEGHGALAALRALKPNPCEVTAIAADRRRLSAIQEEREAAARRFFDAHAHEWDAIRSLHVAEAEVERAIIAAIAGRPLGHMLDVGTGTGRMVELLASKARRVTALDRSPEMLRLARARLTKGGVPCELVHGDFASLPLRDNVVDSIIVHQVLHYARAPEAAIAELARVLAPGGLLLIVDFAPHEREELRREAAHARLGFSDAQMRGWFASAGLALETVESLAGDPLIVKIWLGRRRRSRTAQDMQEHSNAG